ncbi:hypothetical protein GGU10DRAFT_98831 [Lentinula aff. detonsa]|uniref:Uncharacterized protein n=1 Tax=Lentinula aff. detonsa TaxID=2804958 RepID=A0AA38L0P0_9AGAR|nr:hypothetical protein GGU10DRAFT_98831 [Lentinula aff. detonsa]
MLSVFSFVALTKCYLIACFSSLVHSATSFPLPSCPLQKLWQTQSFLLVAFQIRFVLCYIPSLCPLLLLLLFVVFFSFFRFL